MDKKKNSSIHRITDPLLEPYMIQFDQYCYTVVKKIKAGNTGKEREQLVGYYTNLEKCLDVIAEDSIKNQDYESVQDFVDEHKARLCELKEISLK